MNLHDRADWILTYLKAAHMLTPRKRKSIAREMVPHTNSLIAAYNDSLTHDLLLEEKIEQIEHLETTLT